MLQHYKEECGRNGREIQQLRDENIQLKARVAYLLQKVDKQSELLKQLPTASSESGPSSSGTLPIPPPVVPPSNVSLCIDTPATDVI